MHLDMFPVKRFLVAVQMPVFRAIKQWKAGQPAATPGLLFNLLKNLVRLEHLQVNLSSTVDCHDNQ